MKKSIVYLLLLCLPVWAFSQHEETRIKHYNVKDKLAIQGYDPVAYFVQNKAIKGKKEFNLSYESVTYYFSSPDNKASFMREPSAYEPQYGGWCAFAMGDSGKKVGIDPKTFKIINGKLYLFYNANFNNTLKSWNKDEARLKANSDRNWVKFFKSK